MHRKSATIELEDVWTTIAKTVAALWPLQHPEVPLTRRAYRQTILIAQDLVRERTEREAFASPDIIWERLKDPVLGSYEYADGSLAFSTRRDRAEEMRRKHAALSSAIARSIDRAQALS
jgi:hypothetical protein